MAAKVPTNGLNHGIPFFTGDTGSIYTHDVSGTDSTAQYNTAYGLTALDAITTGDQNTSIGYGAGGANQTGAEQVNIGYQAGLVCTSSGNVLIGKDAGLSITSGEADIHIGVRAGDGYDTESNNVSIGVDSLGGSIAGGEYNTAVGNFTLDALTSGDYNVVVGYNAGTGLTTGSSNVLIGTTTTGTITGNDNTCLGDQAGKILAGGGSNTYIGNKAGVEATSGSNNTCVGHDAGRTGSPGGSIGTGSNNLHLGDENVSSCQIQTDWTVASDQRDKTDFTALDIGLDFVNALKPYTYKWDKRIKYVSEEDRDTINLDTITHDGTHKEDWLDIGFKAQEVEVLEKAAGYKIADKTNLTTSLTGDGKQYGIKYSNFVPILVKAVQELSAKVKALEDA
jgi:hypothetical protein